MGELQELLAAYVGRAKQRLHVPAHGGRVPLDVTEVWHFDDLAQPTGVLKRAQEQAATCYGAEGAAFLVNGATAGIFAMLWPYAGKTVIFPRAIHRSVWSAIQLARIKALFVATSFYEAMPLPLQPRDIPDSWLKEAKAIFAVSPLYHGVLGPVADLADLAHRYGLALLIDSAHGAHLGKLSDLPPHALTENADAVVFGLHKTMGSLTQTALLTWQGSRVDAHRMQQGLRLNQTTSPSYLLLASMEAALEEDKSTSLRETLMAATYLRSELANWLYEPPSLRQDPLRLSLQLGSAALLVAKGLEEVGIFVEYADMQQLLLVLPHGYTISEAKFLSKILKKMIRLDQGTVNELNWSHWPEPERVDFWLEGSSEPIELKHAMGRIAAEIIAPYPPGVPFLLPGELFSAEHVRWLEEARDKIHIHGLLADKVWVKGEK